MISNITANGNTITVVLANPDLDPVSLQNFKNINVVQWSDDSTELLGNIRKNMKCGGGNPVYHPCKTWISLVPDYSQILSETNYNTQIAFVQSEIGKINRPDRIQLLNSGNDWNNDRNIDSIISMVNSGYSGSQFSLKDNLGVLYDTYRSRNRTEFEPPFVALVFIPTTATYENYGGADDTVQKLKAAGFQLTFFLLGPDTDEHKLTNYTTNFVYWRNMSNPQPENWDQVRLQAYGCQNN